MENNSKPPVNSIEEGILFGYSGKGKQWHISFRDEVMLFSREENCVSPKYHREEVLVRALRSELKSSIIGRDMDCSTRYYFGCSKLEVRLREGEQYVVECTFPIVQLVFSHSQKSFEDRKSFIDEKSRPIKRAVSLQEAIMVFPEPYKAVYRVTSDAEKIRACTHTKNSGKSKEIPLKSATWGGVVYSYYLKRESGEAKNKDILRITIPPDFNGLFNPIFDDRRGEMRYLHVWEEGYSRMLPFTLQQRER